LDEIRALTLTLVRSARSTPPHTRNVISISDGLARRLATRKTRPSNN
jgi:hypothetical protein